MASNGPLLSTLVWTLPFALFAGSLHARAPVEDVRPALASEIETRIFELTNIARRGHRALEPEPGLQRAARQYSERMLRENFFGHVDPQGNGPTDRIANVHRRLIGMVGENVLTRSGLDPSNPDLVARAIVDAWLASPGHRANLESDEFTHLGVGIAIDGTRIYATQDFAFVRAYTADDVPLEVRAGDLVSIRVVGRSAVLFDLFDPARGRPVQQPASLSGARWRAPAGRYLLRFYIRSGSNEFGIYTGPEVRLR